MRFLGYKLVHSCSINHRNIHYSKKLLTQPTILPFNPKFLQTLINTINIHKIFKLAFNHVLGSHKGRGRLPAWLTPGLKLNNQLQSAKIKMRNTLVALITLLGFKNFLK